MERGFGTLPAVTDEPLRVWIPSDGPVDLDHRPSRLALVPIARAHRDRRADADTRHRWYASLLSSYLPTEPSEAEVAVLPTYLEQTAPEVVRATVAAAEASGLRTLVFGGHDLEPVLPSASMVLLHPGPTRGAQPRADVLAVPYFFTERTDGPPPARPDGARPSVAFCGQGSLRPAAAGLNLLRRVGDTVSNRIRPRVVTPPVRGHVRLRSRSLRVLHDDPGVDDHFVVRDQYRAGASTEADRVRTQAEFDQNLASATYALCVRGTGNFSARFFEALSVGRIPLFVDTRCVLPFEDEIDWRRHTVWVDAADVGRIGEILVAAHPAVVDDPDRSVDSLRRLFEDRLSQPGFFAHMPAAVRRLL